MGWHVATFNAHGCCLQSPGFVQRTGAQHVGVQRVAFLGPPALLLDVFRTALAGVGYHDGRDVTIEVAWPAGDRLDLMTEAASRAGSKANRASRGRRNRSAGSSRRHPGRSHRVRGPWMAPLQPAWLAWKHRGRTHGLHHLRSDVRDEATPTAQVCVTRPRAGRTAGRCQGCAEPVPRSRTGREVARPQNDKPQAERSPNPDFDAAFEER